MTRTRTARSALLAGVVAAAVIALTIAPASAHPTTRQRVTQFKFGMNLTTHTQPSNAGNDSCHFADPQLTNKPCTRVGVDTGDVGAVGGHLRAPNSGVITKILLIANDPGTMTPYVAKITNWAHGSDNGDGQVTAHGPSISYVSSVTSGQTYTVQSFAVNIHVQKGEYLGIRARRTSMLRCTQGSVTQLLFQPPLAVGDAPTANGGTDDCVLLIEAVGHTT